MEHLHTLWKQYRTAPFDFPTSMEDWQTSLLHDVDSEGKTLFDHLEIRQSDHGFVQFGITAFGFNDQGECTGDTHHKVIRCLSFAPEYPEEGELLLKETMTQLGGGRIHAFFHYFGFSICARHGKLHQQDSHVHDLLLKHHFRVEHENVYYSKALSPVAGDDCIQLLWKAQNEGSCREFAAVANGKEICWGQIHFLPQGDLAYLRWIYLEESKQHQGYGSRIMQALFAQLYEMGIRRLDTDTALDNIAAQGYYEKNGFTNCGITRSYYT